MAAETRSLDPTQWTGSNGECLLPTLCSPPPFYPISSMGGSPFPEAISRELVRLEAFEAHALEQLQQVKELWLSEVSRAIADIEALIREKCSALAADIVRGTGDVEECMPLIGEGERLDLNIDLKPLDINTLLKQFVNLKLDYAQPLSKNSYLYKFFGSQNSIIRFDVQTEEVGDIIHCSERFLHNAAWLVTSQREVYITGGSLMGKSKDDCLLFHPESNTINPLKAMQSPRRSHAMIQWTSRIYVFGGVFEEKKLVHSEYYEGGTEVWSRCSDLICPRAYHGAAMYRNYVYIAGGSEASGLERLSPSTGTTELIALDIALTESCSIVSLDDSLLLLHGNYQGEIYQLDPEASSILRISPMCHGNSWSNCSPIRQNDLIYTVRADSVFRLDVTTLQSVYVTRLGRAAKRRQGDTSL